MRETGVQQGQCLVAYFEALNQSIRYSYAYLFATQIQPQHRPFNNKQIQVRDFYNQAVAYIVNHYRGVESKEFTAKAKIGLSDYWVDLSQYPTLNPLQINQLISTYNLKFTGLRNISRRDGFGAELVVELKQPTYSPVMLDYGQDKIDIFNHPNIHQARYIPATIVVEPMITSSVSDILNQSPLKMRVFDPNKVEKVQIANHVFDLAANFSAPYGLWLANDKMGSLGLYTLLGKENQSFITPRLFMLEPYNPNKKLMIMIHGLASSPEAWGSLSNDIMRDKRLKDHYQVWQVFYSTNLPILENRYQIYHLLEQSFAQIQHKYPKHKIQDTLLIGHSIMGNAIKSNDPKLMNDGIVPYTSSHIDGTVSEKVVLGGHSIQEKPEAVLELERILHLHLLETK